MNYPWSVWGALVYLLRIGTIQWISLAFSTTSGCMIESAIILNGFANASAHFRRIVVRNKSGPVGWSTFKSRLVAAASSLGGSVYYLHIFFWFRWIAFVLKEFVYVIVNVSASSFAFALGSHMHVRDCDLLRVYCRFGLDAEQLRVFRSPRIHGRAEIRKGVRNLWFQMKLDLFRHVLSMRRCLVLWNLNLWNECKQMYVVCFDNYLLYETLRLDYNCL